MEKIYINCCTLVSAPGYCGLGKFPRRLGRLDMLSQGREQRQVVIGAKFLDHELGDERI